MCRLPEDLRQSLNPVTVMSITTARFRQSVARTRELQAQVAELEERLARVTDLYQQFRASNDPAENRELREKMGVPHPMAIILKLGKARAALHKEVLANLQHLREACDEAHGLISTAAGGPGALHVNPRALLLNSRIRQAAQAACRAPKQDRPAAYDAVIEALADIDAKLKTVREAAANYRALVRKGRHILVS